MVDPATPTPSSHSQGFSVLFVCTANLCRSVIAETLMRHAISDRLGKADIRGWVVSSAGTEVHPGSRLPHRISKAMTNLGMPDPHKPRQLTESIIEKADLILTAERAHRLWVLNRVPAANRRTHTIRQFARDCAAGRAAGISAAVTSGVQLVDLAQAGRAHVQRVDKDSNDVADPMRKPNKKTLLATHRLIAECIEEMWGPLTPHQRAKAMRRESR